MSTSHTIKLKHRGQISEKKTLKSRWNIEVLQLYLPLSSSNISIPNDQQSAELSWPLFRMISGATYSGVPQNVHVFLPRPTFLAKPKSPYNKERTLLRTLCFGEFPAILMDTYIKKESAPAWHILCGPVWCSQVWGLCRWSLWNEDKPEPRLHSLCRNEWCHRQRSPFNGKYRSVISVYILKHLNFGLF